MATAKEIMGGGISAVAAQAIGGAYVTTACLGSSQATAAPVTASMTTATAADATLGLRLPAGMQGDEIWIFNNAAATCPVYPPVGAAICVNGTGVGSANAAFSQLTYKLTIYKYFTSTQIMANTSA